LLKLLRAFREDPRSNKIDLGVGVFRDEHGRTPITAAVLDAERVLLNAQTTKAYVAPEGDGEFVSLITALTLGDPLGQAFVGVQSVGGTGALRLGCELLRQSGVVEIFVPTPTWPNHPPIIAASGLAAVEIPFFDLPTQTILFDGLLSALGRAPAGCAVLLQACCHNPLGADFSLEQWAALADVIARRSLIPFIDAAYQGFGVDCETDLAGPRALLSRCEEGLVAISCAKNFGLYRERVGALVLKCAPSGRAAAISNLNAISRATYSMPADHGASVVRLILGDPSRRATWLAELQHMTARLNTTRAHLGAARCGKIDLAPIASQHGMFSTLPLSAEQVIALRERHGVYMTDSARINVVGFADGDIERFVAALDAL
jgi:aromatic-amino-acid transaminase